MSSRYSINVSAGSRLVNGVRCGYAIYDSVERKFVSYHRSEAAARKALKSLKNKT